MRESSVTEEPEGDWQQPIKISISDPATGKVLEEKIIENDYVIITAGRRYVKYTQVMGKTHMICVATAGSCRKHKWIVLRQKILAGRIIEEDCKCEKCGALRQERPPVTDESLPTRSPLVNQT